MYFLSLGRYCMRKCLCIIFKCYLCTFTALLSISHNVRVQFRTFTVSASSVCYLHSTTLYGTLLSAFFLCDTVIFQFITGPWEWLESQITTYTTLADFRHTPRQFGVTINAGLESHVLIDTLGCCKTNKCCTRSTPSHIVISVPDLEVKFNFPLQ